jgi:DNA processing protein
LVTSSEPGYPPLLRHIHGAPPLLSVIGGETRPCAAPWRSWGHATPRRAGQKMTRMLARDLGVAGYVVVSGLARGIDAAAHRASLATGTVAVLAGGMDRIYPEENLPLAEEIVAQGGALVTEMPLGWEPRARDFPRRNRLVSGCRSGWSWSRRPSVRAR